MLLLLLLLLLLVLLLCWPCGDVGITLVLCFLLLLVLSLQLPHAVRHRLILLGRQKKTITGGTW